MSGLHFDLPFYFFLLFILIGFGLSFILYKKELNKNLLSRTTLRLLFFLRSLTLISLFFLILGPKLFNSENIEEHPILIFAQDNSESIKSNKDSSYYLTSYKDSLNSWMKELKSFYDVRVFTFGDKVEENDHFEFKDKSTNLETLFESLENQLYSSNFTDLIIASDGIFNVGKSPRHLKFSKNVNTHSIILGDTMVYPDISIKSIIHNKYALLQNKFPIEISINSNHYSEKIELFLYKNGELVSQKKVKKIDKGIHKFKFLETADKKGIQNYKVEVKSSLLENNIINNTRSSLIEIIDYSQKILVLSSAPHPDIAAINDVLKDLPKSKSASFLINEFTEKLTDYDLVIFHSPFINDRLLKKLRIVKQKNIPALVLTGQNIDLNSKSISLIGMGENKFKGSTKSSALVNDDFNLFNINKDWINKINQYPPLNVPFSTDYKMNDNSKVLFYQSINKIKMPYPLIYFFESLNNTKYCTILGEGIWRWKMSEYQNFNNDNGFKSIFKKIIQALKKVDKKERLKVKVPSISSEDQTINIYAEYYNAAYELQKEANIQFKYTDSLGNEYVKWLDQVDNNYEVNLFNLNKGYYNYIISSNHSEEKFVKKGKFRVVRSNREAFNTVANPNSLQTISSNKQFYHLSEIRKLLNNLKLTGEEKLRYHKEEVTKDLIHYKWIMIILVLLPFLEWLIRKNNGLI